MKLERNPDDEGIMRVSLERHLVKALLWVNEGLTAFKTAPSAYEMIGDRWETHPDRKTVDHWLASIGANDDSLVIYFASVHVLAEWSTVPARTPRQHRKLFGEIDETARRLMKLLATTEEHYYRGGGHGLQNAAVCDLFTEQERQEVLDAVQAWNESHPVDVWENGMPSIKPAAECFPSMEDLLERIASAAKRLQDAGPLHSQPNKKGAMNGYFIRRMDRLLRQRYDNCPDEVLAAIATVILGVAIDADLVRKTVNLPERSKPK